MRGTAITIRPGETLASAARRDLDAVPDFLFYQAAVGGAFLRIPRFDKIELDGKRTRCAAYCNSSGLLNGMAPNTEASRLYAAANGEQIPVDLGPAGQIVGPVLILTGDAGFWQSHRHKG